MLGTLLSETLKGKSIHRTLTNIPCRSVTLSGAGLDLGANDGKSSYWRFFHREEHTHITFTDLYPGNENVLCVDLEKAIPVADASQDFLLLMHVLEHLFDYRTCLSECYRVLRPGGHLIGSVSFLLRVHPGPEDWFRFTKSCLERMLREAGFPEISVEPLGYGPFTAGVGQYGRVFKLKILVFASLVMAIALDWMLDTFFRGNPNIRPENFPLAYFFIAQK